MKRNEFDEYVKDGDFAELFNQLGWNEAKVAPILVDVEVNEEKVRFNIEAVADKNGFKVYTCQVAQIPKMTVVKAIDKRLRKFSNDYILIFIATGSKITESNSIMTHGEKATGCWVVPVKTTEKRVLVPVQYANTAQLDFLYSKHKDLLFGIEEETTILDVTKKVQGVFALNSEKITKDFYAGFKKQHNSFADFITGIENEEDKMWYVSVMLNRLMFCYFIQKKFFLDFDTDYLRHKLEVCKAKKGKDEFFKSFYKSFLRVLFEDGLNKANHDTKEFREQFGRIPYLNGGMFDEHQIEKQYKDIDIADEAFENLFDFFDKYRWHLDTRIEASGKDINPDVLGYIFEQYINDRAQMGAYYTKEDITNYIGKNCILPYLWNAAQEKITVSSTVMTYRCFLNDVMEFLKASGDKYIYDSVKHGVNLPLPENIAVGLDTKSENLVERRKDWNTATPSEYGLPTEIWRETVARRERYAETKRKIESGEVKSINDFITLNLDITSFTQDYLSQTTDSDFVKRFYGALKEISILDPTCGSGAFLFAALNILEPLYEICIDRLDEVQKEIKDKYRSNIQYFIYKNIILRNLYGVDIMAEAVEIARLRLFLKMVAVVEADRKLENLGLDPLPDIDFNIRSGNTLVGFATLKELKKALSEAQGDFLQQIAAQNFGAKIREDCVNVSKLFNNFRALQNNAERSDDIKAAKAELQAALKTLNKNLNALMAKQNGVNTDELGAVEYYKYLEKVKPFHWIAEFYEIIIKRGGFDVIIGNPPYVNIKSIDYISDKKFCSDLYAFVLKRTFSVMQPNGRQGFIVMHNLAFSRDFKNLRTLLKKQNGQFWFSFYGRIPSGLFAGDVRVRNCIYIYSPTQGKSYTTRLHRWFAEYRDTLFQLVRYSQFEWKEVVPMFNSQVLADFFNSVSEFPSAIKSKKSGTPIYFKKIGYNWITATEKAAPCYDGNTGKEIEQSELGIIQASENDVASMVLFFCGKMFFTYWLTYGDEFHVTRDTLLSFYPNLEKLTEQEITEINELYKQFKARLDSTVSFKLNAGKRVGTYQTATMWDLTDKSDMIFLRHLTDKPEIVREAIEENVVESVVTGKNDTEK